MVLELSALKLLYCHSGLFVNIVNPYSWPNQYIEITSASVERQPRSRVMAGLAREATSVIRVHLEFLEFSTLKSSGESNTIPKLNSAWKSL